MPELKLENSLVDNRYEVRERLSRGSYAEIFVAFDRELQREIVIKALNTSLQGTPDVDLERTLVENFQNEAVALDAVRHPNVILRWGHGTAADLNGVPFHYLVLEYMPGGDLLRLCRSNPGNQLRIDRALFYFKQVCEALAYAHGKGIIHRDLKPNNFLLSANCRILKIADFGVAKITTGEDTEITRVGADLYAPPEHHPDGMTNDVTNELQVRLNRLTAAADTYSLAKSFYTVVCGRAPNQFKADPIAYLPDEMMNEPWADQLLAILKRATEDEPSKRYSTVVEFWSDLAQIAAPRMEDPKERDTAEDETIVKPRLNVMPSVLPAKPLEPEFEPTLASTRSHASYTSATPVKKRQEAQVEIAAPPLARDSVPFLESSLPADRERASKIFIPLREPKPAPAAPPPANPQPMAKRAGAKPDAKKLEPHTRKQQIAATFTETLRRRMFISLLILAFLGGLVSVYNFVRGKNTPFGFGPPTEVEVVSEGLNVRIGPHARDPVLGIVEKGSRHRVLVSEERGWLQIEVSRWSELKPHAETNTGWINGNLDGNPNYVRVVSRRWW
jgi:serine/threonine protein kinase